jgi:hypothetical protein
LILESANAFSIDLPIFRASLDEFVKAIIDGPAPLIVTASAPECNAFDFILS